MSASEDPASAPQPEANAVPPAEPSAAAPSSAEGGELEPGDGDAESGPSPLVLWFKRQPLFAFLLLALAIGSPFGVMSLKERILRTRLTQGLGEWHDQLSAAGLPVPWLTRQRVLPPGALSGVTREEYASVGLEEHYLTLTAWSALLDGTKPEVLPESEGWGAAIRACGTYREAAAVADPPERVLQDARNESSRGPGSLRPTLALVGDLLAQKHEQVIGRARTLSKGAPKACTAALSAMSVEATRRHVLEVIRKRPPSTPHLRGLLDLDAKAALTASLESEGPKVAELLTLGAPNCERAEVVLELLLVCFPKGIPENDPFVEVWSIMQGALGDVLRTHLSNWALDAGSAARVLKLGSELDAGAELTPLETFAQWRSRLNEVVDQPTDLLAFAERVLELGWAPSGLEELVASHFVVPGGKRRTEAEVGARLGRILADALVVRLGAEDQESLAAASKILLTRATQLEDLLAGRRDPLAQRARAQLALTQGQVLARAGSWALARSAYERAVELGYEPRFRLLSAQIPVRQGQEDMEGALTFAREALGVLEKHAAAVTRAKEDEFARLAWELAGYPVQTVLLDALRGKANLQLAELLLASGGTDEAAKACQRALQLDSRNARVHLVLAQVLHAQGRTKEARKVVFDGLRGLSQARKEDDLRRELREFLKKLGPN